MHVLRSTLEADTYIRRMELEWQTKVLATFISHTVDDAQHGQKLIDAAQALTLTGDRPEESGTDADTSSREESRTIEEIMEHGNVEEAFRRNALRKGSGLPFMN